MTAPAEDPRGGEGTCRHCGVDVRTINWALGPELMHSPYPHHTRDAYRYCRGVVAELAPPAAGRGDTDSGEEACRYCGDQANCVVPGGAKDCLHAKLAPAARPAGDRAQPTQEPGSNDVAVEDVRAIAVALGLGGHARPYSAHEVARREILPAISALLDAQAAVGRVREALRASLTATGLVAPVHIAVGKVYDALDGGEH